MSFREESGGEDGGWSSSASDMRKSFLHTGSCYKMSAAAGMGSRQSSLMERLGSSAYSLRDGSVSAVLCTLIVALGPIQFGFTCGYSSPTQDAIISHLGHARAFGLLCSMLHVLHLFNLLLNWFVQDCSFLFMGRLLEGFGVGQSFLFMGRLLEGFGVGVISYTVPVYIAEIAPQNMRGALGSVNQLFVTIGILLASLLGMFVPWRILAVLAILYVFINSSSRDLSSLESALRRGDI